ADRCAGEGARQRARRVRACRKDIAMKALQFTQQGRPTVAELPIPEIADDEVLVAARSVGICHSDIDLLEDRYIIPVRYPIIPGHEWSGEVAKVGSRVTELSPGDRVV